MMSRTSKEFGEAVTRVLQEHSLSQAQASYKTGVDRFTIGQMKQGYVPRLERLLEFIRGFGLDVNEWLALAGYEPIEPAESPAIWLTQQITALGRRLGRPVPIMWHPSYAELTQEEAQVVYQRIEADELARGEGEG